MELRRMDGWLGGKGMNQSIMAMAFSEHLMKFVMENNGLTWTASRNAFIYASLGNSKLVEIVGTAVCNLISKAKADITACKDELVEMHCTDNIQFSRHALASARYYFKSGYKPGLFLSYCAMVGGVGMLLYNTNEDIPKCSAEIIAIVATAHILTDKFNQHGGYLGLIEVSSKFNAGIEKQKSRAEEIKASEQAS